MSFREQGIRAIRERGAGGALLDLRSPTYGTVPTPAPAWHRPEEKIVRPDRGKASFQFPCFETWETPPASFDPGIPQRRVRVWAVSLPDGGGSAATTDEPPWDERMAGIGVRALAAIWGGLGVGVGRGKPLHTKNYILPNYAIGGLSGGGV